MNALNGLEGVIAQLPDFVDSRIGYIFLIDTGLQLVSGVGQKECSGEEGGEIEERLNALISIQDIFQRVVPADKAADLVSHLIEYSGQALFGIENRAVDRQCRLHCRFFIGITTAAQIAERQPDVREPADVPDKSSQVHRNSGIKNKGFRRSVRMEEAHISVAGERGCARMDIS